MTITLDPALQRRLDQIARDTGQAAETILREGVQARLEELERATLAAEVAHFERQHAALKEKYLRQYIAMHHGEVVDADADLDALYTRVLDQWGATILLIRQVREEPEAVFHFHSVRLPYRATR